jgi:putative heme-binding domain-containing protein
MKAIGRSPSQGALGIVNAHVIAPGDPTASVLYYRVSTTGQGRMPLVGSRQVDTRGARLLYDWIAQLPTNLSEDKAPPPARFRQAEHEHALLCLWTTNSSRAEVNSALDILISSPNGALALLSAASEHSDDHPLPGEVLETIARHPSYQVRELFARFLPERLRPKTLGPNVKPEAILALKGDADTGRRLFLREEIQCARCHRIQGDGRDFGPDLSQIGRKYSKPQLLDQILNPSKSIEPAFTTYEIETKDGASLSGFVLTRTADEIVLKNADLEKINVPTTQIKRMQPLQLSAMPEGILQNMTAQDAADLLAFLSSLK